MNSIEHVWGNKIGTPTQVKIKVKAHAAGPKRQSRSQHLGPQAEEDNFRYWNQMFYSF